jgi:hypothetical protein
MPSIVQPGTEEGAGRDGRTRREGFPVSDLMCAILRAATGTSDTISRVGAGGAASNRDRCRREKCFRPAPHSSSQPGRQSVLSGGDSHASLIALRPPRESRSTPASTSGVGVSDRLDGTHRPNVRRIKSRHRHRHRHRHWPWHWHRAPGTGHRAPARAQMVSSAA